MVSWSDSRELQGTLSGGMTVAMTSRPPSVFMPRAPPAQGGKGPCAADQRPVRRQSTLHAGGHAGCADAALPAPAPACIARLKTGEPFAKLWRLQPVLAAIRRIKRRNQFLCGDQPIHSHALRPSLLPGLGWLGLGPCPAPLIPIVRANHPGRASRLFSAPRWPG